MEKKIINKHNFQNIISIIIPSRQFDYLLEKSINEIRFLYKDVHIIVVLDEIVYTKELDKNITVLKSINTNISAKRNLGAKYSDKKYIAFIDSDAYPKKGWLENAVDFMEKNDDYDAVTGCQFNAPDDTFEQKCLRLIHYSQLICHKEFVEIIDKNAKIHDCEVFSSANVILRRDIYLKLQGMDENLYLAEDNEFSNRFSQNNHKIKFIPEVSVYHREGQLYSFLKKGYAMSYYYSNILIKGHKIKSVKQTMAQLFPLIGVLFYILLCFIFYIKKINFYLLLILPFMIFCLLIKESYALSAKLQEQRLKGFIFILMTFCLFSCVWVTGTFLGLINFPTDVKKYYKHY